MSEKPSFLGPTEIATSNPVGDVEIRKPKGERKAGHERDLVSALRVRLGAVLARARASRVTRR